MTTWLNFDRWYFVIHLSHSGHPVKMFDLDRFSRGVCVVIQPGAQSLMFRLCTGCKTNVCAENKPQIFRVNTFASTLSARPPPPLMEHDRRSDLDLISSRLQSPPTCRSDTLPQRVPAGAPARRIFHPLNKPFCSVEHGRIRRRQSPPGGAGRRGGTASVLSLSWFSIRQTNV